MLGDYFFKVLRRDGVGHGNRLRRTQPFPQIRRHDAVDFKAVDFFKPADGPRHILAGHAINHPGICPCPVKQHLQLDRERAHPFRHDIDKLRRVDLIGGQGCLAKTGGGIGERQGQKAETCEFFHVYQRDRADFVPRPSPPPIP